MFATRYFTFFSILIVFFNTQALADFSCKRVFENHKHIQLLRASKRGDTEQVEKLLNQGIELNSLNKEDKTPLMYAAENGEVKLVQMLISAGLDIDAIDSSGKTALIYAVENKHKETVLQLIKNKVRINDSDRGSHKTSALWTAINNQDEKMVQILVDNGADLYKKSKYGEIALTFAVLEGGKKIVNILLNSMKVSQVNLEKHLMLALKLENIDIMKLLIDRGANVNRRIKYEQIETTFLNEAVLSENKKSILLLLNKNADINMSNFVGETALMLALETGNIENILLLINRGADIRAINSKSDSITDIVIKKDLQKIFKTLIAKGINVNSAIINKDTILMKAVKLERIEIMKQLIKAGADIDAIQNGETALMKAVKYNKLNAVKLLLENGADTTIVNDQDQTVWDLALEYRHEKILELLPFFVPENQLTKEKEEPRLEDLPHDDWSSSEELSASRKRSTIKGWLASEGRRSASGKRSINKGWLASERRRSASEEQSASEERSVSEKQFASSEIPILTQEDNGYRPINISEHKKAEEEPDKEPTFTEKIQNRLYNLHGWFYW